MTSTDNHAHTRAEASAMPGGPTPREFRREARMLPLSATRFHPRNLRTEHRDLETLAARIHSQGVLKPLLAHRRWIPQPDKPEAFELIAGHRRLLAAEMVGLSKVPVTVRQRMDDDEALLAMLAEDSQDPLTAGERWSGIEALHTEFCYDLSELQRLLGWTPTEMAAIREGRAPAPRTTRLRAVPTQRRAPARSRSSSPRIAPKRVHQLCRGWDEGAVSGAEIVAELRSMLGTWTPKSHTGGAARDTEQAAAGAEDTRDDGEDPEGMAVDSRLWWVPVPQPSTLAADEYDPAIYRTELTGYDDGSWRLCVDAVLVAETDSPLDQDAAQEWARRQMGEGVTFLNGTFFEPSRYWVANPDIRHRRSRTESTPTWRRAAARDDRSS